MSSSPSRPNLLIIWGDDVGIWNLSCYHRGMMGGSTPNIDRIANEGALFLDQTSQAECTAGRAAFITGQYPVRTGMTTVGLPGVDIGLQPEDPTLAELLKPHGYACGQFGKNHLGDMNKYLPTAHGFDEFHGILYHLNAGEYETYYDFPKDEAFRDKFGIRGVIHSWATDEEDSTVDPRFGPVGKQRIEDDGPFPPERMKTLDDEFLASSLRFLEESVAAEKPFFIWHNTTRMHMHTHLPPEYEGKSGYGLYADGMMQMDDHVGVLLDKLDELGIADNTIVMFATDNGAACNSWPDGGNTPFHGEKGTTWEGGFRIPCVVRWPGTIPAGSVCAEFIALEDWLPTFMAAVGEPDIKEKLLAGYQVGDMAYKVHLDGYDQTAAISGQGPGARKEFYYFAESSFQAVRYGDWKFHFITQDKWFNGTREELVTPLTINLKLDPFERFIEARGFDEWQEDHAFLLGPVSALIGQFVASFQDYPMRQRGFNIDVNALMAKAANAQRQ